MFNFNYFLIFICILVSFLLSFGLFFFYSLVESSSNFLYIENLEKTSGFECGFIPYQKNIVGIKFYIISLIFLLFDLEIVLLFPLAFLPINLISIWVILLLLFILVLSLFYEMKKEVLFFI